MASEGTTVSTGGGLAGRYAAALYALASEQNALDSSIQEIEHLSNLITQSADFRRLIDSPVISTNEARNAVLAVLQSQGFGKTIQDFVGVIANNRRLSSLSDIVNAFNALVAEKRGVVTAHVSTAHPLNDTQRQSLRARLIEAGYGNVNIAESIDPTLLGGLVVKIGARLYDTSLKSRLQRLSYAMKGAA